PLWELGGLRDRRPAAGLRRPTPGNVCDLLVEHGPENLRPIRLSLEYSPTAGRSRWYQQRRGILPQLASARQGFAVCRASLRLARLYERCGRPGLVPQLSRLASEPAGAARSLAHGTG